MVPFVGSLTVRVDVLHPIENSAFRGSRRRVGVLTLGIVLIGANLRASIAGLGPILPDIQAGLHLGSGAAGLLNALPLLVFALLSLVAPVAGRRYGLERMLGYAVAAILVGTVVRSLPVFGAIWLGTVVLSVGIAFGNVLLPGLAKRDFPLDASWVIGLYAAAMAGSAGLAAGLAVPIARLPGSGWEWSLGVWAILALVTLLVWAPQMRGPQHHALEAPLSNERATSPWKHAVGWQVSLFFVLHSLVFYSIIDWFSTYAVSVGFPIATTGWYLLIYQLVAVATNLGCAPLIRRSRDQRLLGAVCGLLLLVGTCGLLLQPGLAILWLVSAGLGAGIAMVTSLSLFALRTRDHHQAAVLSGMAQFVGYAGAALGPLLTGLLHEWSRGWTLPLAFLAGASALVLVFATLAGRDRVIL